MFFEPVRCPGIGLSIVYIDLRFKMDALGTNLSYGIAYEWSFQGHCKSRLKHRAMYRAMYCTEWVQPVEGARQI
jgi:hypothetical protein